MQKIVIIFIASCWQSSLAEGVVPARTGPATAASHTASSLDPAHTVAASAAFAEDTMAASTAVGTTANILVRDQQAYQEQRHRRQHPSQPDFEGVHPCPSYLSC